MLYLQFFTDIYLQLHISGMFGLERNTAAGIKRNIAAVPEKLNNETAWLRFF